jgi:glycosyltransferase involved in cell wall biosynthesis
MSRSNAGEPRGGRRPRVSVGLPVHNGENFLEEAIESILNQTFEDFELIISDNASIDATEAICRVYAKRDERIRYHRNRKNVGAAPNFNFVVARSTGEYFKWAAHDDVCRPDFLRRCVEVLDDDPSVVLCHPKATRIDAEGRIKKQWASRPELSAAAPHRRFREALTPQETLPIWGGIRGDILKGTALIGGYPASDRPLLAELSLHGRFHEIPEVLFLHREHAARSVRVHDWRKPHQAAGWYDPRKAGRVIFPEWRLVGGYLSSIRRAPLGPKERLRCYLALAAALRHHHPGLFHDLVIASGHVPGLRAMIGNSPSRHRNRKWKRRLRRLARDLESVIPAEAKFIFVDQASIPAEAIDGQRAIPFLERDGQYWGNPHDDDTALQELIRLHRSGAKFIVFAWPSFWWLEHYPTFHAYLKEHCRCLLTNDRLIIFDLRGELPPPPRPQPRSARADADVSGAIQRFPFDNIYYCCTQKTASQWFRAIFGDRVFFDHTGLVMIPYDELGLRFARFDTPFRKGAIATHLYVDYATYLSIPKPDRSKAFFILRDPRDIVVSWYFSARHSHPLIDPIPEMRKDLVRLSLTGGMKYIIDKLEAFGSFAAQRSWMEAQGDPNVKVFRYEEFARDNRAFLRQLLDYLEIEMPPQDFDELYSRHAFKKLAKGRSRGQEKQKAHYRKGVAGDWQNYFDDEVMAHFRDVTKDTLALLGYDAAPSIASSSPVAGTPNDTSP